MLITTSPALGQNGSIAQPRSTELASPNESSAIADSGFQVTVNPISDGAVSQLNLQVDAFDNRRIDAPTIDNDLSQFQSFDRTGPGSQIGSNFFGLNDNFDEGLLIRSGNVAMKIGGFLKVDFIQDFDPIGSTDSFDVTTIEVGALPRKNNLGPEFYTGLIAFRSNKILF